MDGRARTVRFLRVIADGGLLALLFVAPLFLGGRHPLGRVVLVGIVWVTATSWGIAEWLQRRPRSSWSGGEVIVLLAVGLLVCQLTPLPSFVLQLFSPSLPDLLPAWSATSDLGWTLGSWKQVSLTPQATREGLCMLLAYGVLFVVTYQRLRQVADIERMLRWIAMAAIAMASLGLIQHLAGNGRFLWVYAHPSRDTYGAVKGPFANPNHFAHFLALGLGPLIWWLRHSLTRRTFARNDFAVGARDAVGQRWVPVCLTGGIAVVLLSILLSFSRGGMLAMACGTLTCLSIYAARRLMDRRAVLVLTTSLVAVVLAVCIYGQQRLASQLATMTAGSLEQIDRSSGRRNVWSAALAAVPDFAILGSGVGSHREVYPRYYPHWSEVEYTHAENGYLQVLLETGVCGFTLLLAGCLLVGYWLCTSLRRAPAASITACGAALAGSCVVSAIHSLVDFVWYIPACVSVVVVQIAAAARLSRLSSPTACRAGDTARPTWPAGVRFAAAFTLIVTGLGFGWARTLEGPARAARYWEDYLAMSLAAGTSGADNVRVGRQRCWDEVDLSDPQTLDQLRAHLQQTLRLHPDDARANLRYATVSLRRFELAQKTAENAMSLLDVRQAARAARFPTQKAQDRWLTAALGDHRVYLDEALQAATRAVQLCPLQGQAYLHLAELSFLQHSDPRVKQALLNQAQRVRPHDGTVLFCLGREAALEGQLDTGLTYWRQAFQQAPDVQDEIIQAAARQVAPTVFLTIFQPDRIGLGKLFQYYRQAGQETQARDVGHHYVQALEQYTKTLHGANAARHWDAIQEMYEYLELLPQAVSAARQAVRAQPGDYHQHYILGVRLWQTQQWDEALEQFRWCMNRRPDDLRVKRKLTETMRGMRTAHRAEAALRLSSPATNR